MIEAKIVAHSKNDKGDELISFELTFPHIILPEILTHRMFSRNTSSSRAIPLKKMIEVVDKNPFIPIAFQKSHTGMQGMNYIEDNYSIEKRINQWVNAKFWAITQAEKLGLKELEYIKTDVDCVSKQLCNRLLEPFMWTKMLMTTGKEGLMNFFDLRCPKYKWNGEIYHSWKSLIRDLLNQGYNRDMDIIKELENYSLIDKLKINESQAEIHIQALAELMYDSYNESEPQLLKGNQWHIPYNDKISDKDIEEYVIKNEIVPFGFEDVEKLHTKIKIATAMAARVSYTTINDEKELYIDKMIKLHDKLIELKHNSPLEHCAKCLDEEDYYLYSKGKDGSDEHQHGWVDNFKGFCSYRNLIKNNKKL